MTSTEMPGAEPIAVIGMACRVPGAKDRAQFWDNLVNGVESVRIGTREEYLAAGGRADVANDPDFVPASSVFPDPEYFDAGMFGMSASEAELRDPQHRLFLELSYTALEDSGHDPRRYPGDIGVYAGSGEDAYQWHYVRRNRAAVVRSGAVGLSVNSHPDYVATLTSFKLGLTGPSFTVHTACSTSLVAVHLACEALRNGECDMALAGGANVELPLTKGYVYTEGGVNSKDGHCRAFDANATGTVWGSGGTVLVLRRLSDAIEDNDDVRAVIIGNAVNNDGDSKVGFTAPSQKGQSAVIAQALSVADVDPRSIGFVEAHGTGTVMGDPIEVAALTNVYQRGTDDSNWCAIGSVKTNIGHLGPAAGATGLLKAVLAVEHGVIPPSLNYEAPNPAIGFGAAPFFVNTSPLVWEGDTPRRAGVSSFGMGGTNAHVIIEQAPPRAPRSATAPRCQLLQISAKTDTALATSAAALASYLQAAAPGAADGLADVAYTLRVGRPQLSKRLAVVAADTADAIAALSDRRRCITGSAGPRAVHPVFLFPGQGAQYPAMGADLYQSEAVYRDAVDECCAALRDGAAQDGGLHASLLEFLTAGGDDHALRQTALAQPALFIVEYALSMLWQSWGIRPRAMIGHSVGEYVAATLAGVFDLPDALRVVAARAQLMQTLPQGAMIAVPLDEDELRGYLPDTVSIAAVNGPRACVAAGPRSAIDELVDQLGRAEISARRLRTSHAFHSAMMDPVLPAFREVVADVDLRAPQLPFASNVTGGWIDAEQATDPSYWVRHARETVRFGDCLVTAAGEGSGLFLECGPGRQLTSAVGMQRKGHTSVTCLPGSADKGSAAEAIAAALGKLWVAGCEMDAEAIGTRGNRVSLPTYPWERQHHWVHPDPDESPRPGSAVVRDGESAGTLDDWFTIPVWSQSAPAGKGRPPARVLLLAGEDDVVRDGLETRGCAVIPVRRGATYAFEGRDGPRVRPGHREDYEALLADLSERGGVPGHIVHCWTLADPPAADAELAWAAQDDGFFSVLALAQALAARVPEGGVHLDVVTAGACDVLGRDMERPEHAPLGGAARVLPLEFPWLTARHLDVDPDFASRVRSGGRGSLSAALIDELCQPQPSTGPVNEPLTALRNGRRWHRRFEPVALPASAEGEHQEAALHERAVYLITGGLGGIGITLAEDLAVRFKARLVLTSREGLPPRSVWDQPESAGSWSPRVRRAIAAILRMERAGAEVHVIVADVADPAALRTLREEVLARFGQLTGIVHAAGVPGGGMAEIKDRRAAEEVLRPKIAGTLALRDVFGSDPIDFVLLCSSVTAVAGGFGQVDYCAANAFLDAHAASGHGWNARLVSANWGAWAEIGMAAETDVPAAFRALRRGERSAPVRHGLLTERHPGDGDASAWCSGTVSASTHWVLADHRIAGVPVLPGTAYLEAARCAFGECYPPAGPGYVAELSDVVFLHPLAVPDGTSAQLRVILSPTAQGADFQVVSATREHARGQAAWVPEDEESAVDLNAIRERCALGEKSGKELSLSNSGLVSFGDRWGNLVRVHYGAGEELALLAAKDGGDAHPWTIQPALLDEAVASGWSGAGSSFLPFGYGRVLVRRAMPASVWSHLRYRESGSPDMATADITLYDEAGRELLRVEDFSMRKVDVASVTDTVSAPVSPGSASGAISPSDGADAFRRLVAAEVAPQVAVSATPLDSLIKTALKLDYKAVERGLAAQEAPRAGAVAPAGLTVARNEGERLVAEIFGELLGKAAVGADEDFFELGGDSLIAVQLIAFLRKRFGVRIPMRRFFADPTVAGIASLVEELLSTAGTEESGS
jgi:phthiocerol/phenolphthiocerol synthesis type-I polyketide synthase E